MAPRLDVVTLAVADLHRAMAFYRDGLGLETHGIVGTEFEADDVNPPGDVVMFHIPGGPTLALYPRDALAKDAGIEPAPATSGSFSIGHLVAARAEVDALLARAERAGGTILGQPRNRPWGIYSGYFADPDGHLWEVIYSPPR